MATAVQVQYRRGTSSQVASFTGAQGELAVDTTNNRVVVQDGATAGGWPAAKLSEVITNARTQVSDGNYAVLTTDRTVAYITLTAARTISLPAASTFPGGSRLLAVDESGACSATKTITLTANGSDLIDGASSAVISSAYGYIAIESNTANKWTVIDQVGMTLNGLSGAVSIASSGGSTVTASGSTVTIGEPGGMLNKFRNGAMDVWQRGTSGSAAANSLTYSADGWIVVPITAGVTWAQAAGRLLSKNALQITGASGNAGVNIRQRIESLIAAPFCSQAVTVQMQVYNGTGNPITPTLTVNRASAQDNYGTTISDVTSVGFQSCPAGVWTHIAYTFVANAAAYNGLEILLNFGVINSNTQVVQITELDIRVTPGVATGLNGNPPPPELRPIWSELAFCQRYFYSTYGNGVAPGTITTTGQLYHVMEATFAYGTIVAPFPVSQRTTPSIVIYSPNSGTSGKIYAGSSNGDETALAVYSGIGGTYAQVSDVSLVSGTNIFAHLTASSEL